MTASSKSINRIMDAVKILMHFNVLFRLFEYCFEKIYIHRKKLLVKLTNT